MAKLDRERYKTRRRLCVPVITNLELIDEHARLDAAVDEELKEMAESRKTSLVETGRPPSADALAEVEARMGTERDFYVLEKMGNQTWVALQLKHPPANPTHRQGYNPLTFPPAALAASCIGVAETAEEAEEIVADDAAGLALGAGDAEFLFDALDDAQFGKLWDAILNLNMGYATAPKSVRLATLEAVLGLTPSGTASTTGSRRATS